MINAESYPNPETELDIPTYLRNETAQEVTPADEKIGNPTHIKIVSANIGGHTLVVDENILKTQLESYTAEGVGIIFLQETGTALKESGIRAQRIQKWLGSRYLVHFSGFIAQYVDKEGNIKVDLKEEGGITTIIDTQKIHVVQGPNDMQLPVNKEPTFWEKPKAIGGPDRRVATITMCEVGGKKYSFINTHLDWQGGTEQRERQLKFISQEMERLMENRNFVPDAIVLLGDLNTINKGQIKNTAKALSQEGLQFEAKIPQEPTVEYAHILKMSPDAALALGAEVNIKAGKKWGSDHSEVILDVEIPQT